MLCRHVFCKISRQFRGFTWISKYQKLWYHELLPYLHYTTWWLKICICRWLYFSGWSPKGDLRIFLISSPSTGNLQGGQWRICVIIVSILVNRWTPVQSTLLGLYCWIWHTWLYWTVPSSDWWLLRHQMCMVSFPRNVFSGNILML